MYTHRNVICKEEESTIEKIVVVEKYSFFVSLRSLGAGIRREEGCLLCVFFCFSKKPVLPERIFRYCSGHLQTMHS